MKHSSYQSSPGLCVTPLWVPGGTTAGTCRDRSRHLRSHRAAPSHRGHQPRPVRPRRAAARAFLAPTFLGVVFRRGAPDASPLTRQGKKRQNSGHCGQQRGAMSSWCRPGPRSVHHWCPPDVALGALVRSSSGARRVLVGCSSGARRVLVGCSSGIRGEQPDVGRVVFVLESRR